MSYYPDYEEMTDSNLQNEFVDYETESTYTESNAPTETTAVKLRKRALDDFKRSDKGYNKITINISNNKKKHIEFYETFLRPGTHLRNAITGGYYDETVGSKRENLWFKVNNATAFGGRRNPAIMYFDTPEQFERHFNTTVSAKNKEMWLSKKLKYETSTKVYTVEDFNPHSG